MIDEAVVEHATVKNLIADIEDMEVGEDLYDAKIRVLGEMVKQHIKEEEEELFPELQSSKMDVDAVGKELAERKAELMAEIQKPERTVRALLPCWRLGGPGFPGRSPNVIPPILRPAPAGRMSGSWRRAARDRASPSLRVLRSH